MFQFRPEQIAQLRRTKVGDGLIDTFAGSSMSAWRDNATQDVLVSDPLGNTSRFSFDSTGLIGGVTTPLGRTWSLANYPDGKVGLLTNPAGHALGVTYTSLGQIETLSSNGQQRLACKYNERQQLARVHHPDGTLSSVDYDPLGNPFATTNRLGSRETYEYDEHRRLTSLTDGNGNRTLFDYGQWERPESARYADGSVDFYTYDEHGFLREIRSGGAVASIDPDPQGRPVLIAYSDGDEIRRGYDAAGRLIESSVGDEKCIFTWDAEGRLTSEQSAGGTIRYDYDQAGRLSGLTYPSGEIVQFQWDADSRISAIRDWNGGEYHWRYAAHDRGWVLTGPNGVATTTYVNSKGLAEAISVAFGSTALHDLRYAYDAEDRVDMLSDLHFGARRYEYDAEGEVTRVEASNPSRSEQFRYDGAGNLVYQSGAHMQVNALNQLTALGDSGFDYDVRGNLIRIRRSEGVWKFTYNARNLMTSAQSPSGAVTTYGYDSFGRRISKTSAGVTTRYIWAGEQMISETTQFGSRQIRQDYAYYPGTYTPLLTRIGGLVYSYHVDHLGTPRALTGPNGLVAWLADYATFGSAALTDAQVRNPMRAPGQYFDEETGLHYNRFRYYSPATGRYLSRDKASYLAGLNFYAYASNNPVNQADPLGLWTWGGVASIAASVVVGVAVTVAVTAVLGPAALPLAIVLAGAAAGAVGFGLNEALNHGLCWPCIWAEMKRGAAIGVLAAAPFAFLPATAGIAAFVGAGALSGAISYIADWRTREDAKWSWRDFALAAGIGAVTAGAGRFLGGRYAQWKFRRVVSASQAAEASASAEARAQVEAKNLTSNKTVASDGNKTVSGWSEPPEGYSQATPEDVAAHSKKIGHELKPAGANDQINRGGFPGKYNASHAEKQMALASPNEPAGVSKPMCSDCIEFYKAQAKYSGQPQTVTDPDMTRVFNTDGTVTEIPKE